LLRESAILLNPFEPDHAGSYYCSFLLVCIDGWVSEFTVVIFGIEVLFDGVGNLKEVGHVD